MAENKEQWHLDKKVPVAIIIVLLTQGLAGAWYMAKLDANDLQQDKRITAIESWQNGTQEQLQKMNEAIARMDERLAIQIDLLKDIRQTIRGVKR